MESQKCCFETRQGNWHSWHSLNQNFPINTSLNVSWFDDLFYDYNLEYKSNCFTLTLLENNFIYKKQKCKKKKNGLHKFTQK